jgi:hypothetical protein
MVFPFVENVVVAEAAPHRIKANKKVQIITKVLFFILINLTPRINF